MLANFRGRSQNCEIDCWLCHVCPSVFLHPCLSVCLSALSSAWNISILTGRFFIQYEVGYISKMCWGKIQVSLKSDKNNGYIIWRPVYMYDHISVLLRMRTVSEEVCRENQNTLFVQYFFVRKSCVYETEWTNTVELYTPQNTIWHMRISFWIPKSKIRLYKTYCFTL